MGCSTPRSGLNRLEMASTDFIPRTQEKEKIVLSAEGQSGQSYVADLNVDGKQQMLHANTTGKIHLEACVIYGTIQKKRGSGTLTFTIQPEGEKPSRSVGFGKLKGPGDRLYFGYHNGAVEVAH